MDKGPGHLEERVARLQQRQLLHMPLQAALRRRYEADDRQRDLRVDELPRLHARIGQSHVQLRVGPPVEGQHAHAREHDARAGPRQLGEEQARHECHRHQPDERLANHHDVLVRARRREAAITYRAERLHRKEEDLAERAVGACALAGVAADHVQTREGEVDDDVDHKEHADHQRERHAEELMVEVQPQRAVQPLERVAHHGAHLQVSHQCMSIHRVKKKKIGSG